MAAHARVPDIISQGTEAKAIRSFQTLGLSPEEIDKSLTNIRFTLEQVKEETACVTYAELFRKSN